MASASSSSAPLVLPGQPLPSSGSTSRLGSGVYQRGPHMLSSLVGRVSSSGPVSVSGRPSRFVVPSPSSLVLGRITRVTPRQATCSILVVDGAPVASGDASAAGEANRAAGEDPSGADFTGVIRMQDVRMTEKDKVRLGDCFRPGDIVRASVISLGDARSYYLSTAANNLGVIYALPSLALGELPPQYGSAEAPAPLEPISWNEMRDPRTGKTEKRKVARPEGI